MNMINQQNLAALKSATSPKKTNDAKFPAIGREIKVAMKLVKVKRRSHDLDFSCNKASSNLHLNSLEVVDSPVSRVGGKRVFSE